MQSQGPVGFPPGIAVEKALFENWSKEIRVRDVWTCTPRDAQDVADICNWAVGAGWTVRPVGIRHGWSPLTIAAGTQPGASIMLCDTTAHLTGLRFNPPRDGGPPSVTVGVGATMEQLLTYLQSQTGGSGAASGYGFPHTPAPGHLTVGAVLAINGHGTAIRNGTLDNLPASYGSLSNQILGFTAVVSMDGTYQLRSFRRGDPDAEVFLTHLGRAFLTEVTLQVVENYNLRCQSFMNISAATMFQAPTGATPPPKSFGSFLEQSGRVEAIWFPFTEFPWLKVWTVAPQQPAGSRAVTAPYNYPFSDNLPNWVADLVARVIKDSSWTPTLMRALAEVTSLGLTLTRSSDIWGASMNTLLYIKDTTLRVTANGYAVQMKRADVQQSVADFYAKVTQMLTDYSKQGKYPINSPMEIRVTNLDETSHVQVPVGQTAKTPAISSLTYDQPAQANGWDVAVWFDLLTIPGTEDAAQFYTELEAWMTERFPEPGYRVMPEWSKGWAYTSSGGAWTSDSWMERIRQSFTVGRTTDPTWSQVAATLATYDSAGLFYSPLTSELFGQG